VTVRFLVEAEAELDYAVAHYEAQWSGLGTEFVLDVRAGLTRIEEFPKAWHFLSRRIRRYRLNRFPYGLLYAELESEIVVVAVMHMHRKPDYWERRLIEL
jgi:toxin ParE2